MQRRHPASRDRRTVSSLVQTLGRTLRRTQWRLGNRRRLPPDRSQHRLWARSGCGGHSASRARRRSTPLRWARACRRRPNRRFEARCPRRRGRCKRRRSGFEAKWTKRALHQAICATGRRAYAEVFEHHQGAARTCRRVRRESQDKSNTTLSVTAPQPTNRSTPSVATAISRPTVKPTVKSESATFKAVGDKASDKRASAVRQ